MCVKQRERDTDTDDLLIQAIAPHEEVQMDDLPPHSTYYNYTYECKKTIILVL